MRGNLDLSKHKLMGAYRPDALRSYPTRIKKITRREDHAYRQTWRIVDGAVRDALANHPEYLTEAGKQKAKAAIVKRVTGALHGYATQVAMGRSVPALTGTAAIEGMGAPPTPSLAARLGSRVRLWWRIYSSPRNSAGAA